MQAEVRTTAVLGPTNTGKTHYAIERMLAHRTGVIGLPLRLLAREVYDRAVAARGPGVVALVTGEERIVPEGTRYWVCTTEAMPQDIGADFLAVDEIQLCADPERGHVFTDRLLSARGRQETLFLGAESMRGAIAALLPAIQFQKRERFSTLTWAGGKKLGRLPARSAIVGFSVENVYAIAELLRRLKGGAAVVMGALSPRTRNAQVAMYQAGEVDYLVATDAIGMGLNLDIGHVAFSSLAKFDGQRMRPLFPHEIGQIAGRAGRHMAPGTFGVTGEAGDPPPEVIEAVENHRFSPIERLTWRNSALDFGTSAGLIASLEAAAPHPLLQRGREVADLAALKALSDLPEVRARLRGAKDVRLLWDVCRIPDFRDISAQEHATLLARIFGFLIEGGPIPDDWVAGQVARLDRTEGDIDTLAKRLAFIRTWTYVAERRGWTVDESHWRGSTRAVEDRLSDALHQALTLRFVDRRTSHLMRRLKSRESLLAEISDKGEVTVEGEHVGRLEGFRFRRDGTASADEAKTLTQAAVQALAPEFALRADRFYNAPDTELDFTEQGGLMWGSNAVGKLIVGADPMRPLVDVFVDDEAGPDVTDKVRRRLQHFIDRRISTLFEPLVALSRDEALTGLARGFAFRLVESLGVIPREKIANEVKELDQDSRGALRKHGVRFGQYTVFLPALLKPAPTRLRLLLWSLGQGLSEFPESPPPGLVTIPHLPEVPTDHYTLSGYRPAGARAIRIDMLERLADMIRTKDSRAGFEAAPEMLSITGMSLEGFAALAEGLGYRATRSERAKVKAAPAAAPELPTAPEPLTFVNPIPEGESVLAPQPEPVAAEVSEPAPEVAGSGEALAEAPPPEMEVFYTFVWAPRPVRAPRAEGAARRERYKPRRAEAPVEVAPVAAGETPATPAGEGETTERPPRGKHRRGKPRRDAGDAGETAAPQAGKPEAEAPRERPPGKDRPPRKRQDGPGNERGDFAARKGKDRPPRERSDRPAAQHGKTFTAAPPRKDRIDPDNPFAALAALRDKL